MGIFSKKPKDNSFQQDYVEVMSEQPNAPVGVYEEATGKFAEIYGSSQVAANRAFVIGFLCVILAIAAVATVAILLPLKEVRPWVVEINSETGAVKRPVEVQKISPNLAVIKAELARWAEAVYTIDPLRTTDLYKYANARSRDKAIGQFGEFRQRENTFQRMQKEPELIREVEVTSVDASQPGVAFLFLTATERKNSEKASPDQIKRYRLTLHYELDPPASEADLLNNPLGLYVNFFNAAEEKV